MAKAKTPTKAKAARTIKDLNVDIRIPFKEENDFVPLEEDATTPYGEMRVRLNEKAIGIFQNVYNELMLSRQIPFEPQAVGFQDPLFKEIQKTRFNGSTDRKQMIQALGLTRTHYEKLANEARQHAMMLAVTYDNMFLRDPRPYSDATDKADNPSWLLPALPEPEYDLSHVYESRFKQFMDVLDDAGEEFQQRFTLEFERAVNASEALSTDSDDAGFQS